MPKCPMYKDITDCDKSPCGKHCNVWLEMQNPEVCPDDHNGCPMDDGSHLCGDSTIYVCTVRGTIKPERCVSCKLLVCNMEDGFPCPLDCDMENAPDPCDFCQASGRKCIIEDDSFTDYYVFIVRRQYSFGQTGEIEATVLIPQDVECVATEIETLIDGDMWAGPNMDPFRVTLKDDVDDCLAGRC